EVLRPHPTAGDGVHGVVGLAGVVPVHEAARLALDPAVAGVVPSPDAGILAATAFAQGRGVHKTMILPEVEHAAQICRRDGDRRRLGRLALLRAARLPSGRPDV